MAISFDDVKMLCAEIQKACVVGKKVTQAECVKRLSRISKAVAFVQQQAGWTSVTDEDLAPEEIVWSPNQFRNLGSLITYLAQSGLEVCCGHLMHFGGRGVFEPTFGKVDIAPEHVDPHNKALDEAMLKGLDELCEVGQGGQFYFDAKTKTVKTFTGILVSEQVWVYDKSKEIRFGRHDRFFEGELVADQAAFNFIRVN